MQNQLKQKKLKEKKRFIMDAFIRKLNFLFFRLSLRVRLIVAVLLTMLPRIGTTAPTLSELTFK